MIVIIKIIRFSFHVGVVFGSTEDVLCSVTLILNTVASDWLKAEQLITVCVAKFKKLYLNCVSQFCAKTASSLFHTCSCAKIIEKSRQFKNL